MSCMSTNNMTRFMEIIDAVDLSVGCEEKFLLFLIAVNLVAFVLYGIDKKRAREGAWRISEKTLIGIAVIGGSIGAIAGMYAFRHKTRHWYFRYGLPMILIAQCVVIWGISIGKI